MKKDRRLIGLLQHLIRIDSQNPGSNERRIARYVFRFLRRFGYAPRIAEFSPKRSNLVLRIRSEHPGKRLLISPHLDTVPAGGGWRRGPFSGRLIGNRIYGRGASDCKGNLAVSLEVLARIKEEGLLLKNTDIIFAATADEEAGSQAGFQPLLKAITPLDYALVLDGSNFEITYAQKGLLHLKLVFSGLKAHGAYLERGRNAIVAAMAAFKEIKEWTEKINRRSPKSKLTLNLGKIEGGERVNIVADRCSMDLDLRFAAAKDLRFFLKEIRRLAGKACKKFSLEVLAFQKPAQTDPRNPLIETLKKSLKRHRIRPCLKVCKGATVLTFLTDKNIPSAVFGFSSQRQAHATDEYISVSNLTKGASVLYDFLIRFDQAATKSLFRNA